MTFYFKNINLYFNTYKNIKIPFIYFPKSNNKFLKGFFKIMKNNFNK